MLSIYDFVIEGNIKIYQRFEANSVVVLKLYAFRSNTYVNEVYPYIYNLMLFSY